MSFYQQSSNTNEYYPIGQDAWNHSKESREHPELHSTGHGTMSKDWDTDIDSEGPPFSTQSSSSNNDSQKQKTKEQESRSHNSNEFGISFGHTTLHVHSPRSIKRDLNNI